MMKQTPVTPLSLVFPLQPALIFNMVSPDTFRKIEKIFHAEIFPFFLVQTCGGGLPGAGGSARRDVA